MSKNVGKILAAALATTAPAGAAAGIAAFVAPVVAQAQTTIYPGVVYDATTHQPVGTVDVTNYGTSQQGVNFQGTTSYNLPANTPLVTYVKGPNGEVEKITGVASPTAADGCTTASCAGGFIWNSNTPVTPTPKTPTGSTQGQGQQQGQQQGQAQTANGGAGGAGGSGGAGGAGGAGGIGEGGAGGSVAIGSGALSPTSSSTSALNIGSGALSPTSRSSSTSSSTSAANSTSSSTAQGGSATAAGGNGTGGSVDYHPTTIYKPAASGVGLGSLSDAIAPPSVECQFTHKGWSVEGSVGTIGATTGLGFNSSFDSHPMQDCYDKRDAKRIEFQQKVNEGAVAVNQIVADATVTANIRGCEMQERVVGKRFGMSEQEIKDSIAADCHATPAPQTPPVQQQTAPPAQQAAATAAAPPSPRVQHHASRPKPKCACTLEKKPVVGS